VSRRQLHLLEVGVRWPPETFVCWKLEGLADRGMKVTVASQFIVDERFRLRGVQLVRAPRRSTARGSDARAVRRAGLILLLRAPRRLLRLVRTVRRLPPAVRRRYGGAMTLLAMYLPLARLSPDVVHFEWSSAANLYLPLFDVWDCPVVTSFHGSEVSVDAHLPGYAVRLPEVLRRSSAVHCVSDSLRREAIGFGLAAAKARVIRQGVDPDVFRPAGRKVTKTSWLRVIAIGWLRWMKGYEYALEAIRSAVDRGVPVQFEILGGDPSEEIGERSERERILHTVADLELQHRVRVLGEVSSAEVVEALRTSDVLLHASLEEGLPTVLLEAMASGLPIVATDCGGVSEAFNDGAEGFLVPPREPEALAEALVRLWEDPEMRSRMGRAGRATVRARFTLVRQLNEFQVLYRELAAA
jgi:glycosyltransferase involved in cell wall biosynthesis